MQKLAQLKIPQGAEQYILYQRTQYLKSTKSIFYKAINKITKDPFIKQIVKIESVFRKKKIAHEYSEDMRNEYLKIKEHLPADCSSILDIGCGIASIDVFLNKHYDKNKIHFYKPGKR